MDAELPMAKIARKIYADATDAGFGDIDYTGIISYIRNYLKIELFLIGHRCQESFVFVFYDMRYTMLWEDTINQACLFNNRVFERPLGIDCLLNVLDNVR